jgi:outer membrane immunogenic protein
MRRLILVSLATAGVACSQMALAADIPPGPPPAAPYYRPAPPPIFTWSGFYLGLHAGGAFGKKEWSDPVFGSFGSHDVSGAIVGGQLGFNVQAAWAVFGVEVDASWAGLKGSHNPLAIPGITAETKVDFLGTIAGRAGVAFDMALLYLKAGGAWAHDKYDITLAGVTGANASETRFGWMIGAGLEYAFAPNWSAKIEYNYLDFGNKSVTFTGIGGLTGATDINQNINIVKAGFNYRFGGPYGRY